MSICEGDMDFTAVQQREAIAMLKKSPSEETLWKLKTGHDGEFTKEIWIDRRKNSKSLAWSSVLLALGNIRELGEVVSRPKALGDIRGVSYIYAMFYRFGLIDVPEKVKEKMNIEE